MANVDNWKPKATETGRNTSRGGVNKNNLVIIQPSRKAPDAEICISLLNTQSCRNKASEVKDFILDNHIDVLALTETWLSTGDGDRVTRSEVTPPGYQLLDVPRPKGRGGRVGLITRDTIHVKKQNIPVVTSSYECMEVLLNAGSCFVRLLIIYRPPSSSKSGLSSSVFLDEFTHHLDHLCTTSGQLLVFGDFNLHYDQAAYQDVKAFKDVLDTFSLIQHVTGPTHRKGHILDLVMTREEELDIKGMQNHGPVISDHSAISFLIPCKVSQPMNKTFTHRNIQAINLEQFNGDIRASALITNPASTLDEAVHQYNSVLNGLLDKHAPEVNKTLRTRSSFPWLLC